MNIKVYQSHSPPEIDLKVLNSNESVKIAIFAGESDLLANPKDVLWLHDQIKDSVVYFG